MPKVYESPYLADCDQVRVALSLEGVESTMRNEFGNPLGLVVLGGVASFTWPEVWVDEGDYEKALEIVNAKGPLASRPANESAATWLCPMCGESIEEPMNACWKCETERPVAPGPS
jgi:hypothetical protein